LVFQSGPDYALFSSKIKFIIKAHLLIQLILVCQRAPRDKTGEIRKNPGETMQRKSAPLRLAAAPPNSWFTKNHSSYADLQGGGVPQFCPFIQRFFKIFSSERGIMFHRRIDREKRIGSQDDL
jgi:hypothetical protein